MFFIAYFLDLGGGGDIFTLQIWGCVFRAHYIYNLFTDQVLNINSLAYGLPFYLKVGCCVDSSTQNTRYHPHRSYYK